MLSMIDCKFAFNSTSEKVEWQHLVMSLNRELLSFPILTIVKHSENVARLERHGYTLVPTAKPNIYQLTKEKSPI